MIKSIDILKGALTNAQSGCAGHTGYTGGYAEALQEAISVLEKQEKYKWHDLRKNPNDLPEEHDSIFAKFKNTNKWTNSMFEKVSDEVLVCFQFGDGTRIVKQRATHDGKFIFDSSLLNTNMESEAITWRYIEPFEEGDTDEKDSN